MLRINLISKEEAKRLEDIRKAHTLVKLMHLSYLCGVTDAELKALIDDIYVLTYHEPKIWSVNYVIKFMTQDLKP